MGVWLFTQFGPIAYELRFLRVHNCEDVVARRTFEVGRSSVGIPAVAEAWPKLTPSWVLEAKGQGKIVTAWALEGGPPTSHSRLPIKSSDAQLPGWTKNTRGRLARKHFSPGAHPAAETPFYIAAVSVSARGDAQCVWSHENSISSSYERKHGSARSHKFTSVKTRRVKLVKLETNYKQKQRQSIAKLTQRPQFLQSTLAQLSSV